MTESQATATTADTTTAPLRKKLIEVALPLEAINVAAAREKSIRHGHPSTLHLWWARRPLAACRAVLFASLVDAPGSDPDLSEAEVSAKRDELFALIEDLVKWENSNNPEVLARARAAIRESTGDDPPPVLDPFCGGGSIPLEAQRLGLEAHASDLNPVAVLITKALIEIPPKFAGRPPVNPDDRATIGAGANWPGATGPAADVRHYGRWMRDEAERRIGHLYPKAQLPPEHGGGEATVIAWLWARTVTCPNPACRAEMPLVASFWLSTKAGKKEWVEPVVDYTEKTVRFKVRTGEGNPPPETVKRSGARCLVCETSVPFAYLRAEGKANRMDLTALATVAEGRRSRIYLDPDAQNEQIARGATPPWHPSGEISHWPGRTNVVEYGMTAFSDLFTPRQLVALTTFSDLVGEARARARHDAVAAGLADDAVPLAEGGTGATAYADAVATYLAFAVDKGANLWSSLCSWMSDRGALRETFARQAIPMVWDFAEANPFSRSGGNFAMYLNRIVDCVSMLPATRMGTATQSDAATAFDVDSIQVVSTDPPYYDNIGYADLSDFFYVWLRRALGQVHSHLFSTLLVPKSDELVATPYRFNGDKDKARSFFEEGLGKSFSQMREFHSEHYPMTIFYAFKQAESGNNGLGGEGGSPPPLVSTGWETMLEGLLGAQFQVTGTWPMRTEGSGRMLARGTNALASSIVLVCRPRPEDAPVATRSEFVRALKRELPGALRTLQHGNIAPVDLAQAAIGPGMAVYSRYRQVLEPNGDRLGVRAALGLINQALDEVLAEQEADYDADTRWAVAWYEQHGTSEGLYGEAETLALAKNAAVAGLVTAGILSSRGGKVALLRRDQLAADWDPRAERRLTLWEITQHLIRALDQHGEERAARILAIVGAAGDGAHDLAYRLYTVCERKGRAEEARAYNSLVVAWPAISALAADLPEAVRQGRLV